MKQFNELYTSLPEKDEHKKSKQYKKLSPKMKDAVDEIFNISLHENTFNLVILITSLFILFN